MITFSLVECRKGVEAILANARRLHDDAKRLFDEGAEHSGALLACYAFDEFGKAFVLAKEVIAAAESASTELSEESLKNAGFLKHRPRLSLVSSILMPILTGLPPGLRMTNDAVSECQESVWKLRNAVAYVDFSDARFQGPNEVSSDECQHTLALVTKLRTFVDEHITAYLDKKIGEIN